MNTSLPYDSTRIDGLAQLLASHVRELGEAGWTPATSSNFSIRVDEKHALITISGRDKRSLNADDLMLIDLDGQPVGNSQRPSAETLLHTQLYRRFADVGCVLHTHSLAQTVASRLFARQGHIEFYCRRNGNGFPGCYPQICQRHLLQNGHNIGHMR